MIERAGRLLFLFVLAATMLGGGNLASAAWQPEISVGLLSGADKISVSLNREARITASSKKVIVVKPGSKIAISFNGDEITVDGRKLAGKSFELRPFDPRDLDKLVVTLNGRAYRGGLKIIGRGRKMTVVNVLPAEEYLRGVLPKEMPPAWPQEALKAQAVAARTYALKNRGRHKSDGYDLCDDVHCQVYEGKDAEEPSTDKAVNATYGEILVFKEKPIDAFFHADSGGMTENSEHVWGTMHSYLRTAAEKEEKTNPWEKKVPLATFEGKFSLGKTEKIILSPLKIGKGDSDRSLSGRVIKVKIKFQKGEKTVSGNDLRGMFGLKSTLFDMRLTKDAVIFSGFGVGHGLGMSQYGAKAWASEKDYKSILTHYYRGTELKKLY